MSENSSIEWTDHTFNPWIGCTKVSPGCANCYAETQDKFRSWTPEGWGKGKPRKRTSEANWKQPLKWNAAQKRHQDFMNGIAERPRVFCASLADWLDDEVPVEWLTDLLELIAATPNLDWLLLTKRPENWYRRVSLASGEMAESWIDCIDMPERGAIPENVWIGTSAEDQTRWDERMPLLMGIPARVRFLSCEPLLEDLGELGEWAEPQDGGRYHIEGIHWIICGGESGPNARPMHPDWPRSLRDQCQAAGVPFFFKQWGEWCPRGPQSLGYPVVEGVPQFRMSDTGENGQRVEAGGDNQVWMNRAGKKSAGRQLDGREWNEFPKGGEA